LWFNRGEAEIAHNGTRPQAQHLLAGVLLYLFRNSAVCVVSWMMGFGPRRRFSNQLKIWKHLGKIQEFRAPVHKGPQGLERAGVAV
jgi:hypothetical protein